ncbi:MAG: T9SS type A sorting domain-containing protein [Gelidibacter sp.]
MKYFYLAITLFFSLNSLGQNDLLGEWFLHYIEVDGVQQYSTIPNSSSNYYTIKTINFNDDGTFDGQVCYNGYTGSYSIVDETTLSITNLAALAGYCDYLSESQLFLSPYLWSVLSDASGTATDMFTYTISGSGDEETLTLTNSENDKAVYGRSPLPESRLPGSWYLHKIVKNGVEELNTFNPDFVLNITQTPGSFNGIDYQGDAVCNSYFGEYYLEGIDNIRIIGYGSTLAFCNNMEADIFESLYRSFLADNDSDMDILLNYDILGSGDDETLILTDQSGDYLVYGRQTLSVSENELTNLSIGLKENPVKNELSLNVDEKLGNQLNYTIYSIDGKLIKRNQILENHIINVENLNSGMYFLLVSNESNFSQTLKFIKQ